MVVFMVALGTVSTVILEIVIEPQVSEAFNNLDNHKSQEKLMCNVVVYNVL